MKIFNGSYPSMIKFWTSNVSERFFRDEFGKDWSNDKILLKHKQCPQDLYLRVINSKCFYKRIWALCQKNQWERYLDIGLKDKDWRVRKAVFNRWVVDGSTEDLGKICLLAKQEEEPIKKEVNALLEKLIWILATKPKNT